MADPDAIAAAQAQAQLVAERLMAEGQAPGAPDQQDVPPAEEYNNKRKFESDGVEEGDAPLRKRASFNGPDAGISPDNGVLNGNHTAGQFDTPANNTGGSVSEVIDCPSGLVGKLIGRQGATIQELQGRSGTRIQVDHKTPGETKKVTISGSAEDVESAKQMIKEVLESENPSFLAGDVTKSVTCPPGIVGRVIGKGGETIRSLQQSSGAHIVVDQNFPEGQDRVVNISGKADAVQRAVNMVTDLINGTPGSAQSVIQKYGVGVTRNMECSRGMVGRIIGKGGETIKNMQKQSGANIQIDQSVDPCKITVTGKRDSVDHAVHMLNDVISGTGYPDFGGPGAGGPGYGGPRPGFQQPFQQYPAGGPAAFSYPYPAAAPAPGGYGYYGSSYPAAYPGGAAAAAPPQQYSGGYQGYGSGGSDPYRGSYGGGSYGSASTGVTQSATSSVWQEQHDDQGRPYYYNTQTGASQWEKPADMQ